MKRSARETGLVALLYVVLAVAMTWPLVLHLGDQVIGPFVGDNLEYVWKIWWVKHALLDLGRSPLHVPEVYAPYGYPLAYGEITPAHTYLGIPLTVLFGPVATYNLFVLASTALSGFCAYLLVREGTGSAPAGIVSGVVYAFCPYRMARIAGNLPLVDTQWIALLYLYLERYLRRRRGRDAALAGLWFALSALSSWYYGAMLALLVLVYLVARLWRRWRREDWGPWLRGAALFAGVSAVLVVPFLLPYRAVQRAGEASVPLEQAAFWSGASMTTWCPTHGTRCGGIGCRGT